MPSLERVANPEPTWLNPAPSALATIAAAAMIVIDLRFSNFSSIFFLT
jgi:hypothetical protein